MEINENIVFEIFGNEENFIDDINFEKINNFLLNFKSQNDLNNILMIIRKKIQSSDIICHILNSEKLQNNKLILILFELFLENKNNEIEIIKNIIKILINKIIINREYIYFICQKIRILDEKNEINENFLLKCIEIFQMIFYKKKENDEWEELSIMKKIKNHYFYFFKLNEGLEYKNISNFPLNNSYLYINFKRESIKDFSIIQIKQSNLFTLNISVKNNLLNINSNDSPNLLEKNIIIENNTFYLLKIKFLITNYKSIANNCFQIELNEEKQQQYIDKKKTTKKEEEIMNDKQQNLDIVILKDFIGIIRSFYLTKIEINSNISIFDINNKNSDYCLILSPLCYKNQIIKDPINDCENKIEDEFFNNSIFKQDNITFEEKIEILLILFEIISLKKFKKAAPILLELVCKIINKYNTKKNTKEYIFMINVFIELSEINWANNEILKYKEFLNLNLIKDLIDDSSKYLFIMIIDKICKKIEPYDIIMYLFNDILGDYDIMKNNFFPNLKTKLFDDKKKFIKNLNDLLFLFCKNPNSFIFLFLLFLLNEIKNDNNYRNIIIQKHFIYILYFYFRKGKFNDLFINDSENKIKNEIISIFKNIIKKVYSSKENIDKECEEYIKNDIFYNLNSLIDEKEINEKKEFNIFKYIKEVIEKEKFNETTYTEPLTFLIPNEITQKNEIRNRYKKLLKFWNYYKKIKKKLFSWNQAYSNQDLFFNNEKKIKYKLSNHLTKEMSLPLLIPILNINNYLPYFSSFEKEQLFKEPFDNVYYIKNLYPFYKEIFQNNKKNLFFFDEYQFIEKNDIEFNVCHVKQIYHDKGFLEINKNSNIIEFYSLPYYISNNPENFDKERQCCYGCLFNLKEFNSKMLRYKCINMRDIDFFIERNYLYEKSSIEIFTTSHKSYYFQFETHSKKTEFIKQIEELKKSLYLNKEKIVNLWKKGNMSNFEYLMKINLLANRSLKDINQYPVFPWLTKNNQILEEEKEKNNNNIIYQNNNNITQGNNNNNENNNFIDNNNTENPNPLQNLKIYMENLKSNLRPLDTPMGLLKISPRAEKRRENYIKIYKTAINQINEEKNLYKIKFNQINQNSENDIPIYDNSIESLYNNPNITFNDIPYVFGSHFSNGAYISHYLVRIFPFTNISIEIQGNAFDSPDRLFINFYKSFLNCSSDKSDVREIIPQFFYLPEIFININNFDFGQIQKLDLNNFDIQSTYYIQNKLNLGNEVNDCLIPYFADNDPYKFVISYRLILENKETNIEDWINLIFGEFSSGKKAQDIGNLFMCNSYYGFVENKLKKENKNKEIYYRLNELGNNPHKIFDKVYKKNYIEMKFNKEIIINIKDNLFSLLIDIYCQIEDNILKIYFVFLSKDKTKLIVYKIFLKSNGEIINKEENKMEQCIFFNNIIIKGYDNHQKFIITDSFQLLSYSLHLSLISLFASLSNPKIKKISNKYVITTLTISKDEKYLFIGTNMGKIFIYYIANKLKLYKKFVAHSKAVNYINDNDILNMFISCSDDYNVNLYLFPNCELVRVIKLDKYFIPDYVFLSSSPLPSIIIYSHSYVKFLSFSLNGHYLYEKVRNDEDINIFDCVFKCPYTVRLFDFNDYLVYFSGHDLIFRKFPFMEYSFKIKHMNNYKTKN